jgi:hypothetical protein
MRSVQSAVLLALLAAACASTSQYHDREMDFGSVRNVAVLPFSNLTRDNLAGERVRDVFANMLLASGAMYVQPQGEVLRVIGTVGVAVPTTPSVEEVMKLGKALKADAVITGVVKEYGEIRSGNSSANVVSVSVQMIETGTGKTVWFAASTRGGIGFTDRLFGGGGAPINDVTEAASRDLLHKLFK